MRFTSRVFACTAVPAALFIAALATSLWALQRTEADFDRYISQEQALANTLTEMYAQGLQMGQALRNVVINPADAKAVANHRSAEEAFAKALSDAELLAAGTEVAARVGKLRPLREAQAARQQDVLSTVAADVASAATTLREHETPAWRALRGELLALISDTRASSHDAHAAARARAERAFAVVIGLAATALAVAVALFVVLRRTLARELGAEPAEARAALKRIAEGDLAGDDSQGLAQGLMAEVQRTRARLSELVGAVRQGAEQIDQASAEIAAGNQDLSARTEQAAASVQQTASSMEQLTSTVQHSSVAAREADSLAAQACAVAQRGGEAVGQVVTTMDQINDGSRRIADIVGVIDGIAFQTNILALNAAVEAARAGDQGRGFAVVAGEVRALAQRSSEAAREIRVLIGSSVDKAEAGARCAAEAGATMQEVVDSVRRVSSVIGEISHAAGEQAGGLGQINGAVAELDRSTQQNSALVEQSAAAAASLQQQANRLAQMVSAFRVAG